MGDKEKETKKKKKKSEREKEKEIHNIIKMWHKFIKLKAWTRLDLI